MHACSHVPVRRRISRDPIREPSLSHPDNTATKLTKVAQSVKAVATRSLKRAHASKPSTMTKTVTHQIAQKMVKSQLCPSVLYDCALKAKHMYSKTPKRCNRPRHHGGQHAPIDCTHHLQPTSQAHHGTCKSKAEYHTIIHTDAPINITAMLFIISMS